MQRCRGTAEDFQSRSASLCIQVRAFVCMPSGYASLARRPPLLRDLTSVPAARATMSWHGQAKKPMMLRGQSVSAGVPDA